MFRLRSIMVSVYELLDGLHKASMRTGSKHGKDGRGRSYNGSNLKAVCPTIYQRLRCFNSDDCGICDVLLYYCLLQLELVL
ncbi:hypothetical protein Pelo_2574 [Pelomyxa schiedti]|nr:hypothetical protein Pelo_2574 [Pelomyxa schiedti]